MIVAPFKSITYNLRMLYRNKSLVLAFLMLLLNSFFCFAKDTEKEISEQRAKLINYSKQFIGVPYVYGGDTVEGMDCSGFVFVVANDSVKIKLPRTASNIYSYVRVISDELKEPGDLVFFNDSGKITHVGIYLGNNQFIHSASSGPKTGVIVSTLFDSYWKDHYCGVGQFLPSSKETENNVEYNEEIINDSTEDDLLSKPVDVVDEIGKNPGYINTFPLDLDITVLGNWNLFTPEEFLLSIRGCSVRFHCDLNRVSLKPGFGFEVKYDGKMDFVQIPLLLSLSPTNFLRVYAGPVFTIGESHIIGSDKAVKGSIFPGVIGVAWKAPEWRIGQIGLIFTQEISYTVFNNMNNTALSFTESLSSGLEFMTGIVVTINL